MTILLDSSGEEKGHSPKRKKKASRTRQVAKDAAAQASTSTSKAKARQHKQIIAKAYPTPSFTINHDHLSKYEKVVAWIDAVMAAGPLEKVREDIVEGNGEIPRAPFTGDWHSWHNPWKKPSKYSRYCSNDRAMNWTMCPLTAEPEGCWAGSD